MEQHIGEAIVTGAGILWKALWALIFGYLISAGIQVLVSRSAMAKTLGKPTAKAGVLASFFGFVSSSCSFAALAAARSIWTKGAHPVNALAFLVASTNLVIELGIVLWVLMGWQFFAANILLGLFMVVYLYLITKFWFPEKLAKQARQHAEQTEMESGMDMDEGKGAGKNWRKQLSTVDGWRPIADAFFMEWKMAYKEILFGFTLAGFITVFVPQSVWNHLFLISGNAGSNAAQPGLFIVLENALIAPVVAFFTFIGSMGNVPLAALLWSKTPRLRRDELSGRRFGGRDGAVDAGQILRLEIHGLLGRTTLFVHGRGGFERAFGLLDFAYHPRNAPGIRRQNQVRH